MTDPFAPYGLFLLAETRPLVAARTEAAMAMLSSPALAALLRERIEQIEVHGHHPDNDVLYQQGELALAAKSYLDTYIDLELRPDETPGSPLPESWPFADGFWREPTWQDRHRALVKALALGLAELERLLAAMALAHAARPLIDQRPDESRDWHM